jgi:hypothetical protein
VRAAGGRRPAEGGEQFSGGSSVCRTGGGRGFFSSIGAGGDGVLCDRWGLGKGTVGWGERLGETGNGLMWCCALAGWNGGLQFFSDKWVHVKSYAESMATSGGSLKV